ncbi:MAG: aminoacyl-tRNA deacylase [Anaerolineae bacterium]|jgi:Cys-tRNA(Pro)/Cys-tRNA(Cys) deacylase|nr:aminoacyl-tRNA deacylase [Anaerolineae bacterium]
MEKLQNNVVRYLKQNEIHFKLHTLNTESKLSAVEVAEILRMDPAMVFKSIVIKHEQPKPNKVLVNVSAHQTVDLKKTAVVLSVKKIHLTTQDEAEQLTGLRVGGISPLALLNKGFRFIIDESALSLDAIIISAGQRGYQIEINPVDLQRCIHADFFPVACDSVIEQ